MGGAILTTSIPVIGAAITVDSVLTITGALADTTVLILK